MSSTLESSVLDKWHSIKNTEDLTMTQMLDISEKLITEQSDEIYGINTTSWENSSWKYLSLIGDEQVISLQRTKVYVFSDSVLCLGKTHENSQSNMAWEEWFKSTLEYRTLDRIDGEPMEFEWNIFPGFTTLQLSQEVQELLLRLNKTPENLQEELSSCRCSTTSHGDQKIMKKNATQMLDSFLYLQEDSEQDNGSFLGPGSEKKWYSISEYSPQGEWDRVAEQMMLKFGESKHPVFRSTSPLSRGVLKSKGGGKLSIQDG